MIYTNVGPFGPLQTDFGDRLGRTQPQTPQMDSSNLNFA